MSAQEQGLGLGATDLDASGTLHAYNQTKRCSTEKRDIDSAVHPQSRVLNYNQPQARLVQKSERSTCCKPMGPYMAWVHTWHGSLRPMPIATRCLAPSLLAS